MKVSAFCIASVLLLAAGPAFASPSDFETTLDTSLLCLDRIDGSYLKSWLDLRRAYANPPFARGGYAWYKETGSKLFGVPLSWLFLSDREIGAIFSAPAGVLAQKIGQSWLGLPYRLEAPGFYESTTFSVIWDLGGGQSELICLDD